MCVCVYVYIESTGIPAFEVSISIPCRIRKSCRALRALNRSIAHIELCPSPSQSISPSVHLSIHLFPVFPQQQFPLHSLSIPPRKINISLRLSHPAHSKTHKHTHTKQRERRGGRGVGKFIIKGISSLTIIRNRQRLLGVDVVHLDDDWRLCGIIPRGRNGERGEGMGGLSLVVVVVVEGGRRRSRLDTHSSSLPLAKFR